MAVIIAFYMYFGKSVEIIPVYRQRQEYHLTTVMPLEHNFHKLHNHGHKVNGNERGGNDGYNYIDNGQLRNTSPSNMEGL